MRISDWSSDVCSSDLENGVPISEDKTWDYADRYNLRIATSDDEALQTGYQTVGLHFNREPRFYADMAFDGSKWFMQTGTYNIQSKSEQHTGKKQSRLYSITGYYTKDRKSTRLNSSH